MASYKILEAVDPARLEENVKKFLESGWQLAGGISVCIIPGEERSLYGSQKVYAQAVTKGE